MRSMVWAAGAVSATAFGLVIAGGLAADGSDGGRAVPAVPGVPSAPAVARGSLEQLARKAGCAPDVRTDAAELRQANCRSSDGRRYVLVTFATERGARAWLDGADDYGGTYLVGRKWVAVGDRGVLGVVRGRLGGRVAEAAPHHAS
ncbi:hypothetical protein [Streptomyces sp. G45]|uniref:hypothetical protein n=1 Tax=Streptomyces sp. G45 TaxID=3406627 RepID=UPI003C160193